jgi:hypothetical protein
MERGNEEERRLPSPSKVGERNPEIAPLSKWRGGMKRKETPLSFGEGQGVR